jgi:hypothetical protein
MKWNLTKVVIVIAVLAIPAQRRLVAQDQPQQKQVSPASPGATGNYNFLIASGFLCDPNDSAACPAVARASDGETVEITGAGSLSGKSVIAVGSFTEKTSNGYIVTTGVWTATGLMSFESYGIDPGALLREHPQFRRLTPLPIGRMMPGPMAGPMARLMAGPIAAGGVAVIRIRLLPDAGTPTDAVLWVNCAKGKVPEDEQGDGVRLTIEGGGRVFDQQVSGHTVFLLRRPAPNFAWKQAAGPTQ